jgi:hypothetical protein
MYCLLLLVINDNIYYEESQEQHPIFQEMNFKLKGVRNWLSPVSNFVDRVVMEALFCRLTESMDTSVLKSSGMNYANTPPTQILSMLAKRKGTKLLSFYYCFV